MFKSSNSVLNLVYNSGISVMGSLGLIAFSTLQVPVSHKVVSSSKLFAPKLLLPGTLFMGKNNLAVRTRLIFK